MQFMGEQRFTYELTNYITTNVVRTLLLTPEQARARNHDLLDTKYRWLKQASVEHTNKKLVWQGKN